MAYFSSLTEDKLGTFTAKTRFSISSTWLPLKLHDKPVQIEFLSPIRSQWSSFQPKVERCFFKVSTHSRILSFYRPCLNQDMSMCSFWHP